MNKLFSILLVLLLFSFFISPVKAESSMDLLIKAQNAYKQNKFNDALKYYQQAQVDTPDADDLKYNIANAYYGLNDYKSALSGYLSVVKSSKSKELKAKSYYNMGNTQYKMNDLQAALGSYLRAISLNPDDKQAKENYEFVLNKLKDQKNQSCSKCKNPKQKNNQNKNKNKDKNDKNQSGKGNNKDKNKNNKDNNKNNNGQNPDKKNKNKDKNDKNQQNKQKQGNSGYNPRNNEVNKAQADAILSNLKEKKVPVSNKMLQGSYFNDKDW